MIGHHRRLCKCCDHTSSCQTTSVQHHRLLHCGVSGQAGSDLLCQKPWLCPASRCVWKCHYQELFPTRWQLTKAARQQSAWARSQTAHRAEHRSANSATAVGRERNLQRLENQSKHPTLVADLTNFPFEFFYAVFTQESSLPFYTMMQKSLNGQKVKSRGGVSGLRRNFKGSNGKVRSFFFCLIRTVDIDKQDVCLPLIFSFHIGGGGIFFFFGGGGRWSLSHPNCGQSHW